MLRFQIQSDKIFAAIVVEGLELSICRIQDLLDLNEEDLYESVLPFGHKVFSPREALRTLEEILKSHAKAELYDLTDYHYLLIYDALYAFTTIHNDTVRNCKTKKGKREASLIGPFRVEEIDFDAMADLFFWDTDFLLTSEASFDLGLEGRRAMGISLQSFAISLGLRPHPEELRLKIYDPQPQKVGKPVYFGPASKVYPDYSRI